MTVTVFIRYRIDPFKRAAFEAYATQHPEVLCLSADLTSSCEIDGFRDRHPDQFLSLGLNPITLQEGLLAEVVDVARKYAHRIDRTRVPAVSAWTRDIAQRVDHDPEGKRLKAV